MISSNTVNAVNAVKYSHTVKYRSKHPSQTPLQTPLQTGIPLVSLFFRSATPIASFFGLLMVEWILFTFL